MVWKEWAGGGGAAGGNVCGAPSVGREGSQPEGGNWGGVGRTFFWPPRHSNQPPCPLGVLLHVSLEWELEKGGSGQEQLFICGKVEKTILTLSMAGVKGEVESVWSRICLEKVLEYSGAGRQ